MGVDIKTSKEVFDGISAVDAQTIAGAVAMAIAPEGGITRVQRGVMNALFELLVGSALDFETVRPVDPAELGEAMKQRDIRLLTRIVQLMLVGDLLLSHPVDEIAERIRGYADALGVDGEVLGVERSAARGSFDLAIVDFERSGHLLKKLPNSRFSGRASAPTTSGWRQVADDPKLNGRWAALEHCPSGSLGLGVWRFYKARGFAFPGSPGSAPPALAQHDWVHVLADYGSNVESEIEVFGLIARSSSDFRAFSYLAIVLSLFESGRLTESPSGFFRSDPGHISRDPEGMGVRLGDAMSRGKHLAQNLEVQGASDRSDLLGVDWFAYADLDLNSVRQLFSLPGKSTRAVAVGSVGPWEFGGMSHNQLLLGQQRAKAEGREYECWGAAPLLGEVYVPGSG
jgi:hypothetical protein